MRRVTVTATFSLLGFAVHVAGATRLQWFPCPDYPNLSCSYFDIPLDYHNSSAGTGQLLVVRANATTESRGTIFLNPGGPGVSGLTSLATDGEALMNRSGGAYDFVSWDPRGVGPYTYPGTVFCLSDEEYDSFWNGTIEATGIHEIGGFSGDIDVDALYAQAPIMDARYQEFGERCLQGPNSTTLSYIGTAATVRDLVGLADAIQGPGTPINYWGLSYGTLVGMWFMNMFPDRVGRVILDGVLDATKIATEQSFHLWRDQLGLAEDAYNAFANACAMAGPTGCKLAQHQNATGADVINYISSAIRVAYEQTTTDSMLLLQLRATIYSALYQPQQWDNYGNELIPNAISELYSLSNTSTTRKNKRDSFSQHSYTEPAVVCADSVNADPSVNMTAIFDEVIDVTRKVSPTFGSFWPIPWHRCSYWPVRAPERYHGKFNQTFANRILIIDNSYDNATPFFEAQNIAKILGDQAALVKQDGFGHTTLYQPSACVANIIEAYLNHGMLPAGNASAPTTCMIDDSVELFPGVRSVDVSVNVSWDAFRA